MEGFRTQLKGFHREDVINFIQQQTQEHERRVRTMQEEIVRLQGELNDARTEAERAHGAQEAEAETTQEELAQASERCAELEAENTAAREEIARLTKRCEALEEAAAAKQPEPAAEEKPAAEEPENYKELELAAYRRAELAERMAKERAAASDEQMKRILALTDERLMHTSQDFQTLLETFTKDFEQLRQVIRSAQALVAESAGGLQETASTCADRT